MKELINDLKSIELMIFDLDGVIYRGDTLISNVDKVIQELKNHSIKVVYNSNNSTATRQMYVERLKKFNISSKVSDIYTSASITSAEITKIKKEANIFVIGEVGLREELEAMGHKIISEVSEYNDVDFVIVGLDRDFKYQTLAMAQKCILEGHAQFYATNTDANLPVPQGLLPGAGAMVSALEACTEKKPVKVFGKPQPFGMELILKDNKTPAKKACAIGDRLETDIVAAKLACIKSIIVLTGVTSREIIEDLINRPKGSVKVDKNLIPDIVINTLNEIFI